MTGRVPLGPSFLQNNFALLVLRGAVDRLTILKEKNWRWLIKWKKCLVYCWGLWSLSKYNRWIYNENTSFEFKFNVSNVSLECNAIPDHKKPSKLPMPLWSALQLPPFHPCAGNSQLRCSEIPTADSLCWNRSVKLSSTCPKIIKRNS